ncbi:MAG: transposase domain-containing protein [Acidobacteria bacterium]|nr:transposase domain-containing protein [Acidobacteriota bacterium]
MASFVAWCRRLRLIPFAYLRDVRGRMVQHPVTRLDGFRPQLEASYSMGPVGVPALANLPAAVKRSSQDG